MRTRVSSVALLVGVWALALGALAQTPPPAASQAAAQPVKSKEVKAKPKKVWTDDDLSNTRKPWDDYADQKQAAEQASQPEPPSADAKDSGKPASGAPVDPKTGKPYEDPNSPKAIEREVAKWENELKQDEGLAEAARREIAEASDPDRLELAKKKLQIYEQSIIDARRKLQQTREQLVEARKRGQDGAPPSPAPGANAGSSPSPAPPPL